MDVRFYNVCLVKSIGFISPQISKSLKFGLWHLKSFFPEGMGVVNPYQTSFSRKKSYRLFSMFETDLWHVRIEKIVYN